MSSRINSSFFSTPHIYLPPSALNMNRIPVDPYIPNPLLCFNCRLFGHHQGTCNRASVCAKCGEPTHEGNCPHDTKSVNCYGSHTLYDRHSLRWWTETNIAENLEPRSQKISGNISNLINYHNLLCFCYQNPQNKSPLCISLLQFSLPPSQTKG